MKTMAALLLAASAALTVSLPVSASAMSLKGAATVSNASAITADTAGVSKGRSCPTDRPYQCL